MIEIVSATMDRLEHFLREVVCLSSANSCRAPFSQETCLWRADCSMYASDVHHAPRLAHHDFDRPEASHLARGGDRPTRLQY